MKTLVRTIGLAVVFSCTGVAHGSIQVGDHIKFDNGPGSPGGVFYVNNLTDPGAAVFATFCVEITEFINFSSTFAVEGIGLTTNKGNKTPSSFTAWLYNSFLDGTLANFMVNLADVNALQLAIWQGMGYTDSEIKFHIGKTWLNAYQPILDNKLPAWQSDFNADVASGDWQGTGLVHVINVRKVVNGEYADYAQDQLVRLNGPPPGVGDGVVPEPLSLVVWSLLALCMVSIAARRRTVS